MQTTTALSEKQELFENKVAELGLEGKWWKGVRFYLKTNRKDTKAFLTFDDPTELHGARLVVDIADNGRCARNWYVSQREMLIDFYRPAFIAAMIVSGQVEDAKKWLSDSLLTDLQMDNMIEAGLLPLF